MKSLSDRRFNMTLLIAFAEVAMVLAALGVYGVMNYTVTLRRRELGIRMALGAGKMDVLRLVLGQGLTLTLIRSEEHTSELQSQSNLVCRLLLEKKKQKYKVP